MIRAFFDSIRSEDVDRLRSLIEESPSIVHSVLTKVDGPHGVAGGTGLHLVVQTGNVEIARLLIEHGIDLEARNDDGRTALHDSIECGRTEIEKLLIEKGATIDICAAAILGMFERVRELLDQDPELVNDRSTNLSPLGWAAFGNQADIAEELISCGARMDDGELLCAASVGHIEVGRVLLEHGADPNEIDRNAGGNALHAAAKMRYTHDSSAFISMLLAAGADPSLRTRDGKTARQIAEDGARQQSGPRGPENREGWLRNFEGVAQLLRQAESPTLRRGK